MQRGQRTTAAVWGLWLSTVLLSLTGIVLTILIWHDLKLVDRYPAPLVPMAALVYSSLGVLIVRRAGNRIGWMLLAEGVGLALLCVSSAYAILGISTHPGTLPAPKVIGSVSEWLFVPIVIGLVGVLMVFPTGTLPSRRWRAVGVGVTAITAISIIGFIITPRRVALPVPGGVSVTFSNPFAIRSLGRVISNALLGTLPSLTVFTVGLFALALVAIVGRYRAGTSELRQQVKWVAFVAVAAVICQAALLPTQGVSGNGSAGSIIAAVAAAIVALVGIPVAITVAILRYGLYGLLAAAVTAVYVVIVAGVGTLAGYGGGPVLTVAAAIAIALLFQPLRRQAQRLANRLVYGERATPYQVLSDFAEHMAGTLGLEESLERMVGVLAAGTGAIRVDVWVRVGQDLMPVAAWPPGAERAPRRSVGSGDDVPSVDDASRVVPVRQGDELLGVMSLRKPKNEPLSPTEDKLIQDLASQAGLVLRNVRLTTELKANLEELRASRRRLVEAQDAERRKIERNLHDGAQQQLVAVALQLGLLERVAGDPERVAAAGRQLQKSVQDALDDLRTLARGIYPPLLADKGLGTALEAQARKATIPTVVESDGIGRYGQEVEAAVYFCVLEAMQNTAKYAGAHATTIRLAETDGRLVFEIEDDGAGFDRERTTYGTGLQGMADRLDVVGGTLQVTSTPGQGTRVRGEIGLTLGERR